MSTEYHVQIYFKYIKNSIAFTCADKILYFQDISLSHCHHSQFNPVCHYTNAKYSFYVNNRTEITKTNRIALDAQMVSRQFHLTSVKNFSCKALTLLFFSESTFFNSESFYLHEKYQKDFQFVNNQI